MACYVSNCTLRVDYYCKCKDNATNICKEHISSHCLLDGNHKLELVYRNLNKEESNNILNILLQSKQSLQDLKIKVQKITKMLIDDIYHYQLSTISTISQYEDKIFKNIKEILTNNEIKEEAYNNYIKIEGLDYFLDNEFFDYSSISLSINDYYTRNFMQSIKLENKSSKNVTKTMLFFKKNTKTLVCVDIKSLNIEKNALNLEKNMGSSAG